MMRERVRERQKMDDYQKTIQVKNILKERKRETDIQRKVEIDRD